MKRQNRQEYVQQMTVNWFLISLDLHWTPGGKGLATLVHRICKAAADGPVSSTIQAGLLNSSWTDYFRDFVSTEWVRICRDVTRK